MIRSGSSGNLTWQQGESSAACCYAAHRGLAARGWRAWRQVPRLASLAPSAVPGPDRVPRTGGHPARCAGLLEVEDHESLRQRPDSGHDRVGDRYHGLRHACPADLAPRQEAAATLSSIAGRSGAKIRHRAPTLRAPGVVAVVAPTVRVPHAVRKAATTFRPPSLLRRWDPRAASQTPFHQLI